MKLPLLARRLGLLSPKFLIALSSLFFLLVAFFYFRFQADPPKVANLFSGTKSGTLIIDAPDRVSLNQPFTVDVSIDTKKQNTNAVGLYILFDESQLQLLNLDTSQSFCQFYPEKKFDNYHGTISISCGSPHPGVSGVNTIVSLDFIPLNIGQTTLYTTPSSKILLSNGKGTNILTEFPLKQISIHNNL